MNTPAPEQPGYSSVSLWFKDTAERALSTLSQVLIPLIILIIQDGSVDWKALLTAVFAAVGSVLLAMIPALVPKDLSYKADVALRLVKTVAVTALSLLIADTADLFDGSTWQAVAVTVGTTILVFVKAEIARRLEKPTITPASLASPPAS